MTNIILVSHGDLATGMKQSVEMIAGPREEVVAVGLQPSDGPEQFGEKLKEALKGLNADKTIIFTDLMGGSPSNTAFTNYVADENIDIITGMNFPMILTTVLTEDISMDEIVAAGKDGIVNLKNMMDDFEEE